MRTTWHLVEPDATNWPTLIDTLYAEADPAGGQLLPDYFIKTTFARMGGRLLINQANGAYALLFPRGLHEGQRLYTARMPDPGVFPRGEIEALLAPDRLIWHDPTRPPRGVPSHHRDGPFDLGAPEIHELAAMRGLHEAIWGGSAAARYPDDLHSSSFQPATSLVARYEHRVVGFLLGFYRFGLAALNEVDLPYRHDLAVESQVMGIAPEVRRMGLAVMLKRYQARQVLAQGLDLIHWTVDPLQFGNARLNFGRLRAVAGACYPAYYPFRNSLNRVPASRLGLVWLPRSAHGQGGLVDHPARSAVAALTDFPDLAILNDGFTPIAIPGNAAAIAIEIPADWTTMQHTDLALALRWRTVTDTILTEYLGFTEGRYLLTDVARAGERCFVIGRRAGEVLMI